MSTQPSPHDAVFRRILGDPEHAASQLRAVLPADLTARLDLRQLTRVSENFVDTNLRWRHSDLLFSAPLDGTDAFIYVLVEHQSRTDPLMPFRMLRYIVRIWDRYLHEHPDATRLPAVLPLVVHHNRRPWTGPTDLAELLDLDPPTSAAAGDYLPRFRFLLDDLTRLDQQDLRARPLTPSARITLLLLKIAAGNTELATDLQPWADDLRAILEAGEGIEDFIALLTYIETVGETPAEELHQLFTELGSAAEEAYVTTAEMLRAEGATKGRADTLLELLELKFGPLPPETVQSVNTASTSQLRAWTARVLTATSLDEIWR
ncbi:Rpn family recombination-promoting nuclease/putative transposase [Microlunatus parietis]|uniref:Transposase (putative) YhgA-like domain-containing protein n=1 Tax=Microlunatus parietis TaxID=682979 RepID=A0A7Y9I4W0_9ACTN|nr:Rpn family recombination-promoting nuclease/putative transposase [Microlunatus parietis]NYE70299.1 hypothetical protein [Microlunatus parietis]